MERVLDDWERVDHTRLANMYFTTWPHKFYGMGEHVSSINPDYFVFTVIRNPYDRYLSGLTHAIRQPRRVGAYWFQEHVMATQKATLGPLIPDYYMRLENIENDYEYIKNRFDLGDLPKLNSSSVGNLSPGQIKWVDEHFAEDFEYFRYERR